MLVMIGRFQARHVQEINAAHEFAPTQNLPDKTFHAGQIQPALSISLLGGLNHFKRMQQLEV